MKERIYKVLLGRYQNQMEEALLKIDALLEGNILPGHEDVIGSVDKLLDKVGHAKEKMAILRQYYGTNQADHLHIEMWEIFKKKKIKKKMKKSVKVQKMQISIDFTNQSVYIFTTYLVKVYTI